jgi:hypothetical protein
MKIRTVFPCFVLFLAPPLLARESTDVIVMKNGDRITCEVKGLSGGVLSVSPSYILGTISVDWSQAAAWKATFLAAGHGSWPAGVRFSTMPKSWSVYTGSLTYDQSFHIGVG